LGPLAFQSSGPFFWLNSPTNAFRDNKMNSQTATSHPPLNHFPWRNLCASVLLGWTLMQGVAMAATADTTTHVVKKKKTVKKVRVVQASSRTPSGETVAERERRLTRECKGRPNAGACLGFAR
jgi:hypothetical protein